MKRILLGFIVATMGAISLGVGRTVLPACDPDNGGITLPDAFCAQVVADDLGAARHLTVAPNGDIYVAIRNLQKVTGGIVALRDTDGDGKADVQERFGDEGGTGIALRNGYLYFAPDTKVVRYRMRAGQLVPATPAEVVVADLPQQRSHAAKGFAFDDAGSLFVNVGAPSNACQTDDLMLEGPGQDPCPQLEKGGGVWKFDAHKTGQLHAQGTRVATGVRHTFALAWNPSAKAIYVVQHGRDRLRTFWPRLFNDQQNAELPSEEMLRVDEGSNFGWPYCYHDRQQNKRVLAPEYGGDGRKVDRCEKYPPPIAAFPAHWAPNDLMFYSGSQLPARYRSGAFIAFHGSADRVPLPQEGYKVVFQPLENGRASGQFEAFADGFAGKTPVMNRDEAVYRATGLAQGPDRTLYIADGHTGRIWRVVYPRKRHAARALSHCLTYPGGGLS